VTTIALHEAIPGFGPSADSAYDRLDHELEDRWHGEFYLDHCGALLDVEPMGEDYVRGMCHDIEDPNFDIESVGHTHLPTNTVVQCQDERSQIKNMAKAMTVLRSRLLEKAQAEADAESSALRKSQVGSGDRSEKIRTYNFPQSRVTDHRINVTIHQLDAFMQGQIEPILEPLRAAYEAERLQQLEA